MSNKVVDYEDKDGRKYKVLIPENAPQSHASRGIRLGPPDITGKIDLPERLLVRLHNELFARNLLSYDNVRANMADVVSAVQHTFSVDAQTIVAIYYENEGGKING